MNNTATRRRRLLIACIAYLVPYIIIRPALDQRTKDVKASTAMEHRDRGPRPTRSERMSTAGALARGIQVAIINKRPGDPETKVIGGKTQLLNCEFVVIHNCTL